MSVKLLTDHYLEFLDLKGGCTGSSESMFVKMPHCWKSHAMAQIYLKYLFSTFFSFIVNLNQRLVYANCIEEHSKVNDF